ncbi:MAG: phosphoribosyltransferase [Thermodesulfobacteriota bacterium]
MMANRKKSLTEKEYWGDIKTLTQKIDNHSRGSKAEKAIVAIGRGGWIPGAYAGQKLDIPILPVKCAVYKPGQTDTLLKTPKVSTLAFLQEWTEQTLKTAKSPDILIYLVDDLIDKGITSDLVEGKIREYLKTALPDSARLEIVRCALYTKKDGEVEIYVKETEVGVWVVFPYDGEG